MNLSFQDKILIKIYVTNRKTIKNQSNQMSSLGSSLKARSYKSNKKKNLKTKKLYTSTKACKIKTKSMTAALIKLKKLSDIIFE